MKTLFFKLVFFVFLLLSFVSCLDEDDQISTYWYWGVVYEVEGMDYDFKVLLDDGVVLIPETMDVDYGGKAMDRVLVYFQLKSGADFKDDSVNVNISYMKVYSIKDIVTKSASGLDTLGMDPICVNKGSIWQSNNLLNVPFAIDVSYGYDKIHSVDLVYFPDSVATEQGGVYLELRHNANGDEEDRVVDGFSSFDMESISPFQNVADSIPYTIVINSGAFSDAVSRLDGYYYNVH